MSTQRSSYNPESKFYHLESVVIITSECITSLAATIYVADIGGEIVMWQQRRRTGRQQRVNSNFKGLGKEIESKLLEVISKWSHYFACNSNDLGSTRNGESVDYLMTLNPFTTAPTSPESRKAVVKDKIKIY
ncbi:hypothetical protein Trydic_g9149 [Trypoxylus dichotomus]